MAALSGFTAFVQWGGAAELLDALTGGLKWSNDIITFFKSNTQGLIQLIVLGLYMETLGLSKSKDMERKESDLLRELLEHALASSSNSAMLNRCLQERFGKEAADQIINKSLKPCPILRGMTVKITVKNCSNGYEVVVELTYSKDGEDFLVAVADDPLQCEALVATGLLSEVFVATPTDDNLVPAKVRKRVKETQTGALTYYSVDFTALSTREKKRLFKNTALRENVEKLRIFEGGSPGLKVAYEGSVTFEITHKIWQPAEYPFTFWLSDRVLEVQSIEVDFRDLTRQQQEGARIHLFMSSLQWSYDIKPNNGVWQFPLHAWLLPGQGLAVIWPPENFTG